MLSAGLYVRCPADKENMAEPRVFICGQITKVDEFKKELFSLRFQQATGQLENTARIKEVRKSIAKIKTVIRERELEK